MVRQVWERIEGLINRFIIWRGRLLAEKLTCPARLEKPRHESPDRWETGWNLPRDRWFWSFKPRLCSYCSGIHPDDAIRLVLDGWECQGTDKFYKKYLNPPGYAEHIRRLIAHGFNPHQSPTFKLPTPPVKVKSYHFDQEQKNLFNNALTQKAEKARR